MEAAAMDKLIDKGGATPQLAQAIGEALDITLKAANLVTVPMLDARFAQHEAKMEARFGAMEARFSALERALEGTKVWAVLLCTGMVIAIFGALAVDHRWLLNREDAFQGRSEARFAAQESRTDRLLAEQNARTERLLAEDHVRTDKLIADDHTRTDKLIADDRARTDKLIAELQAQSARVEARMDAKLDQLRSLLRNRTKEP